jgi:hypothetical protein
MGKRKEKWELTLAEKFLLDAIQPAISVERLGSGITGSGIDFVQLLRCIRRFYEEPGDRDWKVIEKKAWEEE